MPRDRYQDREKRFNCVIKVTEPAIAEPRGLAIFAFIAA